MSRKRNRESSSARKVFRQRVVRHAGFATAIMLVSLAIGMLGYHFIEKLSWLDALLNASMILGGMGPVADIVTPGGKFFASIYALYSGLIILAAAGVLIAPLFHRFMKRFDMEVEPETEKEA